MRCSSSSSLPCEIPHRWNQPTGTEGGYTGGHLEEGHSKGGQHKEQQAQNGLKPNTFIPPTVQRQHETRRLPLRKYRSALTSCTAGRLPLHLIIFLTFLSSPRYDAPYIPRPESS